MNLIVIQRVNIAQVDDDGAIAYIIRVLVIAGAGKAEPLTGEGQIIGIHAIGQIGDMRSRSGVDDRVILMQSQILRTRGILGAVIRIVNKADIGSDGQIRGAIRGADTGEDNLLAHLCGIEHIPIVLRGGSIAHMAGNQHLTFHDLNVGSLIRAAIALELVHHDPRRLGIVPLRDHIERVVDIRIGMGSAGLH